MIIPSFFRIWNNIIQPQHHVMHMIVPS
uniref:Uncharacterized protein n=1 Tax=Arundo donax TaxID=35708 RepID=A0A0A8Z5T9_ARUDO